MDGDRTESDWQGLVSEVRPGLPVGLRSRCSGSPSPTSPGSRWPRQEPAGARSISHFRACGGAAVASTIWCQALGRGLSLASVWPRIGETLKPWDPGGERA